MRKSYCDMPRKKKVDVAACPCEYAEDAFGAGAEKLSGMIGKVLGGKGRLMLVADYNVVQRNQDLGSKIGAFVKANGFELAGKPVVIGGGEKIKCDGFQSAGKVANSIVDARIGRDDLVLVLGGGTLFDVAGWAAAQARGGLRVMRMPTTIAAMVDAAFADNAALDTPTVKDALRVPCPPAAVFVDPTFARTVLDGVWRGGFAEAARMFSVFDASLMRKLAENAEAIRNRDFETMSELVRDALALRQKKAPTTFALWCAMRLEAMSGYKLPHGYAVAIAMCIDIIYAIKSGLLDADSGNYVRVALAQIGALDGMTHSQHILRETEHVICGLYAWELATGSRAIHLPAGLGKLTVDENPDVALYQEVLKDFAEGLRGE